MKKTDLRKYAKLVVRIGGGVQKGQPVVILSPLCQPEFTTMVAEEAYKAGASTVEIRWNHPAANRLNIKYQTKTQLKKVDEWLVARSNQDGDTLPCRISLRSLDPDAPTPNLEKSAIRSKALAAACREGNAKRAGGRQPWTLVGMPNEKWAKKVFPNDRVSVAMEKLWQAIFKACRMDEGDDPVEVWNAHLDNMQKKCDYLNSLKLKTVRFYAANGTDITFGMIPEARFINCNHPTPDGKFTYCCDLPTEECYITPDYRKTNGIVYGALPWCYNGKIIEDYWLKFEDGKVADFGARTNEDYLKHIIETDEGSHYLGEFALVPKESPVRQMGVLFYDMLFDENAACHFALGRGFPETLEDSAKYTAAEAYEKGVNRSSVHQDFMIGTDDLNVDGVTQDGKTVAIFRDGTWAL